MSPWTVARVRTPASKSSAWWWRWCAVRARPPCCCRQAAEGAARTRARVGSTCALASFTLCARRPSGVAGVEGKHIQPRAASRGTRVAFSLVPRPASLPSASPLPLLVSLPSRNPTVSVPTVDRDRGPCVYNLLLHGAPHAAVHHTPQLTISKYERQTYRQVPMSSGPSRLRRYRRILLTPPNLAAASRWAADVSAENARRRKTIP